MINVLTWNMRRSSPDSRSWDIIRKLSPDVCLLQEVGGIPKDISDWYKILQEKATNKNGVPQKFSTVILSKEPIEQFRLKSSIEWVSKQLDFFSGNFLCGSTNIDGNKINLMSEKPFYSTNGLYMTQGRGSACYVGVGAKTFSKGGGSSSFNFDVAFIHYFDQTVNNNDWVREANSDWIFTQFPVSVNNYQAQ
jgi:hypothetical protein